VSWAERWAKAKENHARVGMLRARTKTFVLGVIITVVGVGTLYSDTKHQINGKPSTATLMEHIKQCTVEYQFIGEEKKQSLQLPCELAEETQRRVGPNKIKISRDFIAHVQFPLADGRMHEAKVDDIRLGSHTLAIGSTLPVVYAPDNPGDVRAAMSWERVRVWLIVSAIGIALLALALGGPLMSLFGWAFGNRTSRAGEAKASANSERPMPTSARAPEFRAPRASFGMRNR
jgi:hypothetical protein